MVRARACVDQWAMAHVWFADGFASALVTDDGPVHALRNTILGPRPWCGAGPVSQLLDEPFTEATTNRCETCADLVLALLPQQRGV